MHIGLSGGLCQLWLGEAGSYSSCHPCYCQPVLKVINHSSSPEILWNLQIFTMIELPERSHPIHFQLQMGWGGPRGTQILPWKSFQIMVLTQRKYNKSVILHLYDRQAAKAFNCGTNGISILTHWLTVYGWAEAPHRSRSSGCSCPCKGILD